MKMKKYDFDKVTPEMTSALQRAGSMEYGVAMAAQRELAKAFESPLRQGVLKGNILSNIFSAYEFKPGQSVEFPLDFLTPGTESDFVAYTIPNTGRIPERSVEGDYVMVRTYDTGVSLDCPLKYLRDARWDVMARMLEVLEAMHVLKANNDGFHVLLAAAVGRTITAYDSKAIAGMFTKRLVAQMSTYMTRNAQGNTASLNRGKLTDLFISLEAQNCVLSWDLTQIPESVRTQIYQNWDNGGVTKIGSVNLHDLTELGQLQDFDNYTKNVLGGTLPGSTQEFCIGLDLQKDDSFVQPIRQKLELFEDPTFHRSRRAGLYGWAEHGFAVLDSRRVLLGAI